MHTPVIHKRSEGCHYEQIPQDKLVIPNAHSHMQPKKENV